MITVVDVARRNGMLTKPLKCCARITCLFVSCVIKSNLMMTIGVKGKNIGGKGDVEVMTRGSDMKQKIGCG